MKLVFVHGRAQEGRSADELRFEWLAGLARGFYAAQLPTVPSVVRVVEDVLVPFYGDRLQELRVNLQEHSEPLTLRGDRMPEDEFVQTLLREMAEQAGIPTDASPQDANYVERGASKWSIVHRLAVSLEKRVPWLAQWGLERYVNDVHAYCTRPHISHAVHEIVASSLIDGPCVVVAHSLGTVVLYRVLTEFQLEKDPQIELLVTLGSPLGFTALQRPMRRPFAFPSSVKKWLNVFDPADVVAAAKELTEQNFVGDVENRRVINSGDDPHYIREYLAHADVAKAIYVALTSK